MKHIHFIVNPIAGKGKPFLTKEFLEQFFVHGPHRIAVKYSTHKKHAIRLTNDSIAENADFIVACGGDGTINEVGSCLVGTSVPLGIVPLGSGNGLASNLNIPKDLRRALEIIRNGNTIKIDVGSINDKYFFSNTGVGFDASVIKNYESSNRRTLIGYISACLASFKEIKQLQNVHIKIDGKDFIIDPFLVFVSNSNEMGYRLSLTPRASLQDGLLDVFIVTKIGRLKLLWLGVLLVMKRAHFLSEAESYQTKNLELKNNGDSSLEVQIDGEMYSIKNGIISIQIQESALEVIVPMDKVP